MHRWIFTFLLGLFFLAPQAAQSADKYGITEKTLENGLDVIVIHNPAVPLVTVEINVKNGGFTEGPEYTGLSHLYEHMFFKANKVIPNQEAYLERLRELGASWNGSTGNERVNYFFTVPKDSIEPAMVFMYDAITGPLFKQEELAKERPVVIGEYDRNEANPYYLLYVAVNKKVWWKYYSRKNPLGERSVILSATTEKMQTIQNRYYIPNNSALILAGDVTPEEGFSLAKKIFSSWKRGPDPFKAYPIPEHPPIPKTETLVITAPVNAVTVMMEWEGPSVTKDPKATYAADILSFILRQKTSKFYKNLVESGLSYGVDLAYQTLAHTGPIMVNAQTSADKYKSFLEALQKELESMSSPDYFTDAQLANAKTILAIDDQYARERPSEFCHTVGYWWAIAGLDYYLNYVENSAKVTRKDISEYLKTYIIGKPYIMGTLLSSDARKKLGF
jgi:zinc protease